MRVPNCLKKYFVLSVSFFVTLSILADGGQASFRNLYDHTQQTADFLVNPTQPLAPQSVLFDSNFDSGSFAGDGWTVVNGTQTNKWFVGTAAASSAGATANAAYISDNASGATFSWDTTQSSTVHFYRDVTFPAGENVVYLTFDMKGGSLSTGFMRVFLVNTTTTPTAGSLPSGQIGLTQYHLQNGYTRFGVALTSGQIATPKRLVFSWVNSAIGGTQPPVAIDNIRMTSKISAPLAGNYTINKTLPTGGTNFNSFNDAVFELNAQGVSAPVVFDVPAGETFVESVPSITVSGTATNTITFQKSGVGANPQIIWNGTNLTTDAVIPIFGGDFLTFNGIDVSSNFGTSFLNYGFLLRNPTATNGSQNNTIKNSKIDFVEKGVFQTSDSLDFGSQATTAEGTNSFNKYYNLHIADSNAGIEFASNGAVRDMNNEIGTESGGETIIENLTNVSTLFGIRTEQQFGLKIFDCKIRNLTVDGTTVTGIQIFYTNTAIDSIGTVEVRDNQIHNLVAGTAGATSMSNIGISSGNTNNAGSIVNIRNNMISGQTASIVNCSSTTPRSTRGIVITPGNAAAGTYNVEFNSVRLESNALSCSNANFDVEFSTFLPAAIINVRNNIFANFTPAQSGTARHFTFFTSSATGFGNAASVSNHNILFVQNPTNGFVGIAGANLHANLAGWQTVAGNDLNSKQQNPQFTSASDLHIRPNANTPIESAGTPIAGVTTDFDGETRNPTTPDIGADEGAFNPPVNTDSAATGLLNPTVGSLKITGSTITPQALFENFGLLNLTNIPVRYKIIGPAPATTEIYNQTSTIASLPSGSGATVNFPNIVINTPGTYTIQAISELAGDNDTSNDILSGTFIVASPLSGNYNVGAAEPAPFNSITSALNWLDLVGMSASTTFLLTDAVYSTGETFPLDINPFAGASASQTLTIKPAPGVNSVITGFAELTTTGTGGLFQINGADFVIIDGSNSGSTSSNLSVINTNTTTQNGGVSISGTSTNGATNNIIKNLTIKAGIDQRTGNVTPTFGILSISAGSGAGLNGNNTFTGNIISKVAFGLDIRGFSSAALETGTTVSNNIIGPAAAGEDQIGIAGIIMKNETNALISGNEIRTIGYRVGNTGLANTPAGIYFGDGVPAWRVATTAVVKNSQVVNNRIHNIVFEFAGAFGAAGIINGARDGANTTNNIIANNMIYDIRATSLATNGGAVGIGIATGNNDKVVFNSISLTGDLDPAGAPTAAFESSGIRVAPTTGNVVPTNLTIKNNAIRIDLNSNDESLEHYAIVAPPSFNWGTGGLNNNDYFANPNNPQAFVGNTGNTSLSLGFKTIGEWRGVFSPAQDGLSVSFNPQFVSETDLHIRTDIKTYVENAGVPVAGVTTDFDGATRNATTPDIGADEGNFIAPPPNDIAVKTLETPTNGELKPVNTPFEVAAIFENLGTTGQANVPVRYRIIGPAPATTEVYNQTVNTAINLSDFEFVTFPDATITTPGIYTIEAKSELPGDADASNDTISGTIDVRLPLSGTIPVGTGQPSPFNTLSGAVNAVNVLGVSGATTLLLTDTDYSMNETFPIVINPFAGASAANTLTIKPAPGVNAAITGFAPITLSIFLINEADFVNIDGSNTNTAAPQASNLTITNTNPNNSACIFVLSDDTGANNITLQNLTLKGGTAQGTGAFSNFGIVHSNFGGVSATNNIYANNIITKVAVGIATDGGGALNNNTQITGNIIGPDSFGADQIGIAGIILQRETNAVVSNNEIRFVGSLFGDVSASDVAGIFIGKNTPDWRPEVVGSVVTNSQFTNNRIHDIVQEKDTSAVGIGSSAHNGTNDTGNIFANNTIYNIRANGRNDAGATGIGIAAGKGDKIVFNSIFMNGDLDPGSSQAATQSASGINISATRTTLVPPLNLTVKNNALHIDLNSNTASLKHYAIIAPTSFDWGTGGANNNVYFINSANSQMQLGATGNTTPYTDFTGLGQWQAAFSPAQDGASLDTNPNFVSQTDLHVVVGTDFQPISSVSNGGTPIAGVTTDFDGETRNANAPDIGADEIIVNRILTTNGTLGSGNVESLTINGSGITPALGGNVTVNGALNLTNGILNTGANTITVTCPTTVSGGSVSSFIAGNLKKDFCATGAFNYPVGTTGNGNEFTPVNVNVVNLAVNPSSLTVRANLGTAPASPPLNDAVSLDRFWSLTETGDLTANLNFNYLQTDVDGDEDMYRIIRVISGGSAIAFPNDCLNGSPCLNPANNTMFIANINTFSDWTGGELAPTAATAEISGNVQTANGESLAGVLMVSRNLTNGEQIFTETDAFGRYAFAGQEVGNNYLVSPARNGFQFEPNQRFISLLEDLSGVDFTANRTRIAPNGDFDGDGVSDIAVFRPTEGNWYILQSASNSIRVEHWGADGDRIVPADYTGDGRMDLAVYRGGVWFIKDLVTGASRIEQFGLASDKVIPADYDGDGKADLAVYRAEDNFWYIKQSISGTLRYETVSRSVQKPVIGDFDGDGKADIGGVFRLENDRKNSPIGFVIKQNGAEIFKSWGLNGDAIMSGDYDADGKTDLAVYRRTEGNWYIQTATASFVKKFGLPTDEPLNGDFDGDGASDLAVFRLENERGWFYISEAETIQFGFEGDIPVGADVVK
jgi:hypothetical protein